MNFDEIVSSDDSIYDIQTSASGPEGSLPLTEDMLINYPSGHLFGMTEDLAWAGNLRN